MKFNLLRTGIPLAMLGVLAGCVDNNYDLSDIDTTSRINVNNLVVPVQLDNIVLNDILKIDEQDPSGEIIITEFDGKKIYAVSQTGEIESDPIKINGFTANPPTVQDATLSLNNNTTRAVDIVNTYAFSGSTPQSVDIKAENVDESIETITDITMDPLHIVMHLTTSGLDANTTMKFDKLNIQFLKGLTIKSCTPAYESYSPGNGMLTFKNLDCPDRQLTITIDATGVNLLLAGTDLAADHTLTYHSDVEVADAAITTVTQVEGAMAPPTLDFIVSTTVGRLVARSFSGDVNYTFEGEGLDIKAIDLNDVPDFLGQEDTYLILSNPQIYLNLNNPLASAEAEYSTGLSLTANRPGEQPEQFPMNNRVEVSYHHGVDGPYNFVLSPSNPTTKLPAFAENIKHVPYSSLEYVVAGNGLPKTIDIELVKPGMFGRVKNLELRDPDSPDTNDTSEPGVYGGAKGSYEFFAPLAFLNLEGGRATTIVYRKDDTGWGDEDLDKLTIETLELDLKVVNNIPLDATLNVYPLKRPAPGTDEPLFYFDKEGNKIKGTANLAISSDSQDVILTITSEDGIKELDGMRFEAVVHTKNNETLAPEQTIVVSSSKAKVSGYYTTDF